MLFCLSIVLSVYFLFVYYSVCLLFCLSVFLHRCFCLSVLLGLSAFLSVCLFMRMCVCVCFCLSVVPSVFFCLSVCDRLFIEIFGWASTYLQAQQNLGNMRSSSHMHFFHFFHFFAKYNFWMIKKPFFFFFLFVQVFSQDSSRNENGSILWTKDEKNILDQNPKKCILLTKHFLFKL